MIGRLSFLSLVLLMLLSGKFAEEQKQVPMICPHGLPYKIFHIKSGKEHCEEMMLDEKAEIANVEMEVYQWDNTAKTIQAFHCTKMLEKVTYYLNWLKYKIISPPTKTQLSMSHEECLRMVRTNACEINNKMQIIVGDEWAKSTNNNLELIFEYFSAGKEASTINCFLTKHILSYQIGEQEIHTPVLDTANCQLRDGN